MKNERIMPSEGPMGLRILAIMLGSALPIQVAGRGTIAGVLLIAFLCFLSLPHKSLYLKRVFEAAHGLVGVMLLLTFFLWLPNAFFSVDPIRSLESTVRTFAFVGLAALFWAVLVENEWARDLLMRSLLVASAFAVVIALIAETALPELFWFLHLRGWKSMPLGTSMKPFSALAVLIIPAFIWAGARLKGAWAVLAAANTIGFLAMVWLTYNRAAIAGLLGIIVIAAGLTALSHRRRLIRTTLPLTALAAVTGVLIWLNTTRSSPGYGDDLLFPVWLIDFQRQMIWNFAQGLFQQNFWFGMGANTINFAPGADALIPHTVTNLAIIPSHPHNWVLEVAVETGIFGILSLIGVIALTIVHNFQRFIKGRESTFFVAACIAAGYWVSGLFNFSFWSSWWQMSFVLMISFCLSQRSASR